MRETGEENRGATENILARKKADESQKVVSLLKNLLTQWETEEENRTRDQSMKNLPIDEKDGEENRKIIKYRYCQ